MKTKNSCPIGLLYEHFRLDSESGDIFWKFPRNKRNLYQPAGTLKKDGYRQILLKVDGECHWLYAHRVAYAMRHGEWPLHEVDHKFGSEHRDNNSERNIRAASYSDNCCNKAKLPNNSSGLKWVKRGSGRNWRAAVQKNYKSYERAGFPTKKQAYEWACSTAKQLHGEFYNPG